MIIYHSNNIAAFTGNSIYYWFGQPLLQQIISKTTAAPTFQAAWAQHSTRIVYPGDWL